MATGLANLVKNISTTVAMRSNVARNSSTRGEPRRGMVHHRVHFLRPLAGNMFKLKF